MFDWIRNLFRSEESMISAIGEYVVSVSKDIDEIKEDLEAAQKIVTELSGGILTAQTELALLKLALANAGITIPLSPPVGSEPKQIDSVFLKKRIENNLTQQL